MAEDKIHHVNRFLDNRRLAKRRRFRIYRDCIVNYLLIVNLFWAIVAAPCPDYCIAIQHCCSAKVKFHSVV